jgi:hypothetical protein
MNATRISLRSIATVGPAVAVASAMIIRAASSWGPLNLVVLAGFVLIASAILSLIPIVPHRLFWAGLAIFGVCYTAIHVLPLPLVDRESLPTEQLFRRLAESHYGPKPNFKTATIDKVESPQDASARVDSFIAASHAITALGFGILGGLALFIVSKVRESRRWDREFPRDRSLEEFLLPPIILDTPEPNPNQYRL